MQKNLDKLNGQFVDEEMGLKHNLFDVGIDDDLIDSLVPNPIFELVDGEIIKTGTRWVLNGYWNIHVDEKTKKITF